MMVKVCGITRPEDAAACAGAGADLLGFIFAPRSPRRVDEETCRSIVRSLGAPRPRCVGVFVDTEAGEVLRTATACGLDMVQLHGAERPEDFDGFPLPVIRSVAVVDRSSFGEISRWRSVARYLLFDRAGGGTGMRFDWDLLEDSCREGLLEGWDFFLAGGLRPEDVPALGRFVRYGLVALDFNSGVEVSPGVKDHAKVREAVAAVKGCCP